jgi:hypothetical protein
MSACQTPSPVRKLTITEATRAQFISRLRRTAPSAPTPTPSPITGTKRKRDDDNQFYVTKLFDYTIQEEDDRAEWRKWRDEQKLPSASTISSYYGLGYRSLNIELRELAGASEKKEINPFTQKLMDHGNDNELMAKNAYMAQTENRWAIEWIANGNTSYIFEISHGGKTCNVLATPDMIIRIPETVKQAEHVRAVEIKCPTYGILVGKKPMAQVVEQFTERYPHGKPGHFLQVATYALLFNCVHFDLFYYFTDTITTAWIKITYELKQEVKESLFEALCYCNNYIEQTNRLSVDEAFPPVKRATGKHAIIEHIKDSFLEKVVYLEPPEELQEEATDQSEDQGP